MDSAAEVSASSLLGRNATSPADAPAPEREATISVVDGPTVDEPDATPEPISSLTDRDLRILEFERHWWRYSGAKEQAIRELFDCSATRYYQILNTLIDNPDALVADPMLVKRLRRMRSARQRTRSARRLGIDL